MTIITVIECNCMTINTVIEGNCMTIITVIQLGGDYCRDDYLTVIQFGAHGTARTQLPDGAPHDLSEVDLLAS